MCERVLQGTVTAFFCVYEQRPSPTRVACTVTVFRLCVCVCVCSLPAGCQGFSAGVTRPGGDDVGDERGQRARCTAREQSEGRRARGARASAAGGRRRRRGRRRGQGRRVLGSSVVFVFERLCKCSPSREAVSEQNRQDRHSSNSRARAALERTTVKEFSLVDITLDHV